MAFSRERQNASWSKYHKKLRRMVLEHYGGRPPKCACCGEAHYEFLTLDHMNNDGAAERRLWGNGVGVFRHIVQEDFPIGYQVLCFNCNTAKQYHGVCPHQLKD